MRKDAGQLTAIGGAGGRSGISGCVNWETYWIQAQAISEANGERKTGGVRERTRVSSLKSRLQYVSRQNDQL